MPVRRMTQRAQIRLIKQVREFVLVHGGTEVEIIPASTLSSEPVVETAAMVLPTVCGKLRITPYGNWIACRFDDVAAAAARLNGTAASSCLNRFSGKWNFHFGAVSAADAFAEFEAGLLPLLVNSQPACSPVLPVGA